MNIDITQINLQHNKLATATFDKYYHSNIDLIQEPYLGMHLNPNSFVLTKSCYHKLNASPRAIVRISTDIPSWLISEFTDRDIATVGIKVDGRMIYVASVYLDILLPVENEILLSLLEHTFRENIPLIIGVDANAHSTLWGVDENARGLKMENLIFQHNLTLLNHGSRPTFIRGDSQTHIDITLVNTATQELLQCNDWQVRDDLPLISDHRAITFQIGQYKPLKFMYRNLKRVDWAEFRAITEPSLTALSNSFKELSSKEDLEMMSIAFEDCLRKSMDDLGTLKTKKTRQWKTWWNDNLEAAKLSLKKSYKSLQKNLISRDEYFGNLREYKKSVEKAKQDSWRAFCTDAHDAKEISKLCKIIQGKTITPTTLIKGVDGSTPASTEESITNLIKAHFPDCTFQNPRISNAMAGVQSGFLDFLNLSRIKESFDSFGKYKAAGPDEIQPVLYQNLPPIGYDILLLLFKMSISMNYIPQNWRKMSVIFIPKTGKNDYGNAKSFRPITLSNFVLKGLERILQWYLTRDIIELPLPCQHAYTEGRSCETALCDAVHYMEENIAKKRYNVCVSLDCSGAFDNISFEKAETALQLHGVDATLQDWFLHLLKGREVSYLDKNLDITRTFYPTKGTPQGGVVSPLLWNLIIDELIRVLNSKTRLKVVCYADDVLLLYAGKDISRTAFEIQKGLNIIEDWAKESGLTFNPSKTQACIVTNKRITSRPVVTLYGQQLEYLKMFKYLGVTIDKTLTWHEHVKAKVAKVKRLSHLAKGVVGNKWGLTPDKCIWILTAIIRPILSYGRLIWAHNLNSTRQKLLKGIQRQIFLAATGCMRSTPTATLEVMLGIPPLHLHIQEVSTMAKARYFLSNPMGWKGQTDLVRGNSVINFLKILKDMPIWGKEIDHITRSRIFLEEQQTILKDAVHFNIYCDGSKMDDNTGMASCITQDDFLLDHRCSKLPSYATVFQAEVLAIKHALLWIKESNTVCCNITVWSDSQAAIAAIAKSSVTSKLVRDAKLLLAEVSRDNRVNILWVRGHNDNTGNELADTFAKEAALRGSFQDIPAPFIALKGSIKAFYEKQWDILWGSLDTCQHSKLMITKVTHKSLLNSRSWSRSNLGLLAEIVSGHCLLNKHLCKWREEILFPLCRLCEEGFETPHHLYAECGALSLYRTQFWNLQSKDSVNKNNLEIYFDYFTKCQRFHALRLTNSEALRV